MTTQYVQLEMRRQRGKPVLLGTGRTPRGQKYIKGIAPITPQGKSVKQFKEAQAAAVTKLFESGQPEG